MTGGIRDDVAASRWWDAQQRQLGDDARPDRRANGPHPARCAGDQAATWSGRREDDARRNPNGQHVERSEHLESVWRQVAIAANKPVHDSNGSADRDRPSERVDDRRASRGGRAEGPAIASGLQGSAHVLFQMNKETARARLWMFAALILFAAAFRVALAEPSLEAAYAEKPSSSMRPAIVREDSGRQANVAQRIW